MTRFERTGRALATAAKGFTPGIRSSSREEHSSDGRPDSVEDSLLDEPDHTGFAGSVNRE
jgi:hypothetical protein